MIDDLDIKASMILLYIAIIVILLGQLFMVASYKNKVVELEQEISQVKIELAESEKRQERHLDTCLDILANGRWENEK